MTLVQIQVVVLAERGQRRKLIMLYVGLVVGAMLGIFISTILLVLVKEVTARTRSDEISHRVFQE